MAALSDEGAIKVMATVNKGGIPNAVVVGSIAPVDEETLVFFDLSMNKTKANLEENGKMAVAVFKPPFEGYQIKGKLRELLAEGPVAAEWNERLYAQTRMQLNSVGFMDVEEVYSLSPQSPGTKLA
jgi:predicted pyridoxine 5'-phosphate oxidase superfamily flavin-nucleotide-binding protein